MAEPNDTPLVASQVVAEHFHLVIPSLPNWIEPTVDYLRQKALLCGACQETRSGKLMVALHEALANAVIHGNLELSSDLKERGDNCFAEALARHSADPILAGRKVDIVVDFDGEVCHWIITDQGNGFDVAAVLARCLSDDPEILLSSGRGILMMKSFLDEVRYDLGGRRVTLSMQRLSGEERRKDTRVPLNLAFRITPVLPDGTVNWAASYEATSLNFSEGGVALLQAEMAATQHILIGIPRNHEILYVPAEVKHSRVLGPHGVELGCHFLEMHERGNPLPRPAPTVSPQLEEVQAAISDLLKNYQTQQLPPHERRAYPRLVFNERVTYYLGASLTPLYAYARDLSKGGMAMIAQQPLAGEITLVFAPSAQEQGLKVRCKVARCTRIKEGFHDIGVAFLRLADEEQTP